VTSPVTTSARTSGSTRLVCGGACPLARAGTRAKKATTPHFIGLNPKPLLQFCILLSDFG
jgi:hypothetical protein